MLVETLQSQISRHRLSLFPFFLQEFRVQPALSGLFGRTPNKVKWCTYNCSGMIRPPAKSVLKYLQAKDGLVEIETPGTSSGKWHYKHWIDHNNCLIQVGYELVSGCTGLLQRRNGSKDMTLVVLEGSPDQIDKEQDVTASLTSAPMHRVILAGRSPVSKICRSDAPTFCFHGSHSTGAP